MSETNGYRSVLYLDHGVHQKGVVAIDKDEELHTAQIERIGNFARGIGLV